MDKFKPNDGVDGVGGPPNPMKGTFGGSLEALAIPNDGCDDTRPKFGGFCCAAFMLKAVKGGVALNAGGVDV